ncbi:MAG: DNA_ligase_IV_Ku-like [uncultured Solirubrobacteraceae bacterium]|uniref:DNA ligase n=1 Tax=uncultured Solirubrobacteraceae bacterium TaxID=1162706 RepID=A0A6J4T6C3_9ACTN|nr:MAG: DNA_ligase_IV_Ku-like [uncultured Solirubrobacteraceae bacterium]
MAATASRTEKEAALAAAIAALSPDEVLAGVALLAGGVRQRATGVGWAALRSPPPPAEEPSLTVGDVDAAIEAVTSTRGAGSAAARARLLEGLLGRATAPEQEFLRAVLSEGVRQGASRTAVAAAVARAAGVGREPLRRALMLAGDLGEVARIALTAGEAGLAEVRLEVGRPIEPMLAGTAPDLDAALAQVGGEAVVDAKLDGVRVQVHRTAGGEVRAFTRTLDEITSRVPEVVEAVGALPGGPLVLDGELIALRDDGRPHPFQVTASRFGTRSPGTDVPLSAFFFDLLHAGGEDLLDLPARERYARLDAIVPAALRVDRSADAAATQARALAAGHEGVVVKGLDTPYAAGRRGTGWIKVKPRLTFDLVVLAAEWGHGRRTGTLSNLHLGARADDGEGFVMLGKTFKGLTDAMLAWQTEALLKLEERRTRGTVWVRPELVVEVAFDGVQASTRYPGGVALRFARVLRHRPDKRAAEADTLAAVLATRPD